MDISPQQIRTAEFSTTRKGLDPDEVREFLERVAGELERSQNQSTAMEARARAAVARLQELSEGAAAQAPTPEPVAEPEPEPMATVGPSEAETISRTLLLAQRTADSTIAEAEADAERLRSEADAAAATTVEAARKSAERLTEEAREEARRAGEQERQAIASEVDALKARRDFLVSDVEHLETFLVDERSRLREAASSLIELTERVPGGLGEVRRPLLSASDDDTPGTGTAAVVTADEAPTIATGADTVSTTDPADRIELGVVPPGDDTDDDDVADDAGSTGPATGEPSLPEQQPAGGSEFFIRTDIADDER